MQVPGSVLVRAHILWSGRHWLMVTAKQMKKNTVSKAMVAPQRTLKVRVKAVFLGQHLCVESWFMLNMTDQNGDMWRGLTSWCNKRWHNTSTLSPTWPIDSSAYQEPSTLGLCCTRAPTLAKEIMFSGLSTVIGKPMWLCLIMKRSAT